MKHIKPLMDALAVWSKRYRSYGDYSVTTLIDSPRIVHLTKRHKHEIKRGPEQQISAFIGSCVHGGFEDGLRLQSLIDDKYDVERTVFDKIEDRLISGTFDILMDGKHLYDIKTCKVWKKIFDPHMEDWHKQVNIYAYMLHRRGIEVKSLNIIALYLDWKQVDAVRDERFPRDPVEEYEMEFWPLEETEGFVRDRINLMKSNEQVADENLPLCTSEEMWERDSDTTYAVMSTSNLKRSMKNFKVKEEAIAYAQEVKVKHQPGTIFVEVRLPKRKRCEEWCDVAPWCNQYAHYKNNKQGDAGLVERIMI